MTFTENLCLTPPEVHRLENLLIEHPSMSVYQMRGQMSDKEDLGSDEDVEDSPRSVNSVNVVTKPFFSMGKCSGSLTSNHVLEN